MSGTPLRGIVGHHKNAGTWLKGYGEADPPTLAVRLRLGLDGNIWPTLVRSKCSASLTSLGHSGLSKNIFADSSKAQGLPGGHKCFRQRPCT